MFFAYLRQTYADWWLNINPKRFAGPIPKSQIKPTDPKFYCSSINSILSIHCLFFCSSFYSRELITRLRRYLSPLITALQLASGNSASIHNGITAWIEVKVSQRHNIILGLDLQSAYRQTDSFIFYFLLIGEISEVPFLALYSGYLLKLTLPILSHLVLCIYNTSNKKI